MSAVPERLMEERSFFGDGYRPVLDFHGWRVAMLRRDAAASPAVFHRVERHNETNEVFILTAGAADLIVCDAVASGPGAGQPGDAHVVPMELNVAYNIGQAVWHHAVLAPGSHIVIFERTDTTVENSDYAELPPERVAEIRGRFSVR